MLLLFLTLKCLLWDISFDPIWNYHLYCFFANFGVNREGFYAYFKLTSIWRKKSNEDVSLVQDSLKYFFVYSFFDYSKMQVLVKLKAIPGKDTLVFTVYWNIS